LNDLYEPKSDGIQKYLNISCHSSSATFWRLFWIWKPTTL